MTEMENLPEKYQGAFLVLTDPLCGEPEDPFRRLLVDALRDLAAANKHIRKLEDFLLPLSEELENNVTKVGGVFERQKARIKELEDGMRRAMAKWRLTGRTQEDACLIFLNNLSKEITDDA